MIKTHEGMTFKRGHVSTTWVETLTVLLTRGQHSTWHTTNTQQCLLKEDNRSDTGWGTSKDLFRVHDISAGP